MPSLNLCAWSKYRPLTTLPQGTSSHGPTSSGANVLQAFNPWDEEGFVPPPDTDYAILGEKGVTDLDLTKNMPSLGGGSYDVHLELPEEVLRKTTTTTTTTLSSTTTDIPTTEAPPNYDDQVAPPIHARTRYMFKFFYDKIPRYVRLREEDCSHNDVYKNVSTKLAWT